MIRTKRRIRLCAVLLVLNLVFIWGNSLLPADASRAFSDWVGKLLSLFFSGGPGDGEGSGLLRKIAHFAEFTALGMCLGWLFGMLKKKPVWPFLLGTGVACVDESIQLLVPDRGPGLKDVLLDSCGVAAGIVLLLIGHYLFIKRSTRKLLEDKPK